MLCAAVQIIASFDKVWPALGGVGALLVSAWNYWQGLAGKVDKVDAQQLVQLALLGDVKVQQDRLDNGLHKVEAKLDKRLDKVEAKLDNVDKELNGKLVNVEKGMDKLDAKLDKLLNRTGWFGISRARDGPG